MNSVEAAIFWIDLEEAVQDIYLKVGPWTVKGDLGRLENADVSVHLKPKVMELLICLAQHAGQVLTKDELLETVWEGTFVSDNVLMNAISELRKALQDNAKQPEYIATIPKRGYRLIASVTAIDRQPTPGLRMVGPKPQGRLAVLPIDTLGKTSVPTLMGDLITDLLITAALELRTVKVSSRTSIVRYRDLRQPLPVILQELQVSHVLEGTLLMSDSFAESLLSLRLYDHTEYNVWAKTVPLPTAGALPALQHFVRGLVQDLDRILGDTEASEGKPEVGVELAVSASSPAWSSMGLNG